MIRDYRTPSTVHSLALRFALQRRATFTNARGRASEISRERERIVPCLGRERPLAVYDSAAIARSARARAFATTWWIAAGTAEREGNGARACREFSPRAHPRTPFPRSTALSRIPSLTARSTGMFVVYLYVTFLHYVVYTAKCVSRFARLKRIINASIRLIDLRRR